MPRLGRGDAAYLSRRVSEMKHADSLVMVVAAAGVLGLGHVCRAVGMHGFSEYVLGFLAPMAPVVGAIFALADVRIPAWRRQAVIALVACGGLMALNLLGLGWRGVALNLLF